tara:strand:- start:28 stop:543 length:516 start_codon:yes stop_codon:yes gene_type:complete
MAYIFKNIDVLDLNPSTGVGIGIPFNGPTGINTTYTTQDAIKSNLLNFILTGKRERVMNPGFGCGLLGAPGLVSTTEFNNEGSFTTNLTPAELDGRGSPGVLFNQITEERIDQIENLIVGGVDLYFPTIQIQDLSVELEPDSKTIMIFLKYTVINTNIEDELQINLNNGGV